jgi:hypothetical protein
MATALTDLQQRAGNRAVTALVTAQRKPAGKPAPAPAGKPPAAGNVKVPNVPVIGLAPSAVTTLPPTADGDQATTLGDTKVVKTDPPEWSVVGAKTDKGWTGSPQPTTVGSIDIAAAYPAPNLYPFGKARLVIDGPVSDLIKAGEQEHSNDLHLAYHALYGVVSGAINRVAAGAPCTGKDRAAVEQSLRKRLCKELPGPLKPPLTGGSPNSDWKERWGGLIDLTLERDRKHWHDMNHAGALPAQRAFYKVPNGEPLERIIPADSIGAHPSQERLDAAAPWLRAKKP